MNRIPDDLDNFWNSPRIATLGTVRADGRPHLVPIHCARDGGEFLVLTYPGSVKAHNVERNAYASLAEHTDSTWVTVEGAARLTEDPWEFARVRAAYQNRYGRAADFGECVLIVEVDLVLRGS